MSVSQQLVLSFSRLTMCVLVTSTMQHTPLIPMVTLVLAHGLSQDLFERYKVRWTGQACMCTVSADAALLALRHHWQ